ncbi:hypothetical protein QP446_10775 [Corynebacterium riegelii]|uniref:hypothetical protein n=1 Tax=Corynebacterium riegelii TaxID=156976 RepID=UPI00254AD321|nr:hypothetical protein [Corynebacterium riegelii]MDK7181234.1 hypothetical protein [Corynebacterium riegelii]
MSTPGNTEAWADEYLKISLWEGFWATAAALFGFTIIVLDIFATDYAPQAFVWRVFVGMLLFGLAFFLPGVWWYYASFKDRKTVREYLESLHQNGYHNPLVAAGDYEETQGTRGVELPSVIKPWWIFVVAGAFAAGIISGLILP